MTRSTEDHELAQMVDRLFASAATKDKEEFSGLDQGLWSDLADLGLSAITAPVEVGGSGGTWEQAAIVIDASTRHGAYLPVAEHDVLAAWLLREVKDSDGSSALDSFGLVAQSGRSCTVPWFLDASSSVLVRERDGVWDMSRVRPGETESTPVPGVVPWHRLTSLETLRWEPLDPEVGRTAVRRGALVRSIQLSAAMAAAVQMTVEHVVVRQQFGRPLVAFQAVQRLVADMVAESALAAAAVDRAVSAVGSGESGALEVAMAKSCTGHATELVARAAHQAHGAIGTTSEHRLHHFTSAMYAWRTDFGGAATWDRWLTQHVLAGPAAADELWHVVTGQRR